MVKKHCALLLATMDTKSNEAAYIKSCLEQQHVPVLTMDAGIRGTCPLIVDVDRETVAAAGGKTLLEVQNIGHEGKALDIMVQGARHLAKELYSQNRIQGIISLGGSMGNSCGKIEEERLLMVPLNEFQSSFCGPVQVLNRQSV